MIEVPNGVNNTDLRETFGYLGRLIYKSGSSVYLFPEECLYARDRNLICADGTAEIKINEQVYVFYTAMRNKGIFLTRSPLDPSS